MIMVHDPAQELKFLQDGYGVNRRVIAYNFFVIVGPNDDPAGIKGLDPIDALKKSKNTETTETPFGSQEATVQEHTPKKKDSGPQPDTTPLNSLNYPGI